MYWIESIADIFQIGTNIKQNFNHINDYINAILTRIENYKSMLGDVLDFVIHLSYVCVDPHAYKNCKIVSITYMQNKLH